MADEININGIIVELNLEDSEIYDNDSDIDIILQKDYEPDVQDVPEILKVDFTGIT